MNAIDALEHELVAAAQRRAERRRTARVRRRWAPIAAAAAIALVGVPAWAAGLLGNVFPSSHDTPPRIGRSYTVASGMTSRGEPWRFELTRGTHFRNGAATGLVVLATLWLLGVFSLVAGWFGIHDPRLDTPFSRLRG